MNVRLNHLPGQVYQQAFVPGHPEDTWHTSFQMESV